MRLSRLLTVGLWCWLTLPVLAQDIVEVPAMIPMRDGVKLSAIIYRPAGDGPWPVLLEQRYANGNGPAVREQYSKLARHGYAVVLANFRGSQQSEGVWQGYRALGWGNLKDGYDLVEWLAVQPWSTGKVGTFGSSQAGFAQNFLAVTRPPHLVAQYMIDTGLSLFHEGYRIGGTVRPQRFLELSKICREPADNDALLAEWFRHPTYDNYWADEDCTRHFDRMNVPCFTIGSWYDFMCVGSIDSYVGRQHRGGPQSRGQQQLLIGPWLHGRVKEANVTGEMTYPERARFPLDAHMIRWFDHYLKGIDNGVEREPTVRYFVMGAVGEEAAPGNEWQTATDWPITATTTPFYLHHDGTLLPSTPTSADDERVYQADPDHPASIPGRAFPGARDARDFEKQPNVLTFTSPVLSEPVEWTGKVVAELFLASDCPDTDVIVRLSDVYPDGRSMLIMDYVRRVRYREGYEKEVLLEPGRVVPVTFDVGWLSQIFNKGHQIRMTIASTGAPFYEPNPNTGLPLTVAPPEKTRIATNRLQMNAQFASRILAPVVTAAEPATKSVESITGLPRRIAFGSCAHQNKPQPVLEAVADRKPDLFVYLGDNIYADTRDMDVLKQKYALLAAKPEFQRLRREVPIVSIWDDHDYGENDAGKNYPKKAESREIFFEFWKVPADSPRRKHDGIYGVQRFEQNGRVLQLILLDTRTFRDPLQRNPKPLPAGSPFKNDYQPDESPEKSFLGDEQWAWLKERLTEPADLRIIASSIQFGHEYNGFESWTNFPREQQKMLDLIQSTRANGVVFLSGDVHWAELSRRDLPGGYPVYDITASGITETWPKIEPNKHRVGEVVPENHFGEIEIDWSATDPTVHFRVINRTGAVRLDHAEPLSTLRFP